ncbi:FtsX-like permease family protein [Clostridium botulinum]|uniref:FtsX-like permease family protein n=1 Tax=Clostridium botulinum TaxID=1491 RepID=UPI001E610EA8|nr:ABC transporter permease [Clostridium botulinum]
MQLFKLVLRRMKSNLFYYFLTYIAYFSALLVILFGFSFLKCSKERILDFTNGKAEHQRLINVDINGSNYIDYDKLTNILKKYSKTTAIRIDGLAMDVPKDDGIYEVPIKMVMFDKIPEWTPPIGRGTYLSPRQSKSKAKIAVIGKGVELNRISENSHVSLGEEKFKIVGVTCKKDNFSNYLGSIFIPLESLPSKMKKCIKTMNIYLLKNNGSPENEMNEILNELNKLPNINATEREVNRYLNVFCSTLATTTVVTFLIILVAVSNTIVLVFYLMLKNKKNILINIALGANKKIIWKQLFIELMVISLVSIISASLVGILLMPFVKNNFTHILNIKAIQFNYFNIIATFSSAVIMSFLISIISVKIFFKLNLTAELKGE